MVRGRKRKPGKRYPCGKRTRQETEKDAMSTVIEARRRHFGVTAKQREMNGWARRLVDSPSAS